MRGPRWLLLDHHETLESGKVGASSVVRERMVRATYLPSHSRDGRAGSRVSRQRLDEPANFLRIPADPVHPPDIHPPNFVQVVAVSQQRIFFGFSSEVPGPATDANQRGQVRKGLVLSQAGHRLSLENSLQGYLPGSAPEFEQRHRSEPKAAHPAGSRVPRDVVGWNGGAGEDEVAQAQAIIDGAPHVVPDVGLGLPLVDQSRSRSLFVDLQRLQTWICNCVR